ncbi:MAG TPA: hypothetical protein DCW55_01025 [Candidatus Pacebacteria bacterium]|nr:hypothetical protein [Candidatus Paceibacterota bacterium]
MNTTLLAAITNPVLPTKLQTVKDTASSALVLTTYIAVLWQTLVVLGGIMVLVNLLRAGWEWTSAAGDKGKIDSAKTMIMQSIVGFGVLAGVAAIALFVESVFGLSLLQPVFPRLLGK